jgi:hypothetical protein
MPEITADERGRRVFQIRKEKAVEGAVEKIRLNLAQDWMLYSISDIDLLHSVLGEAWVAMDRRTWGLCAFTRLTKPDIERILGIAKNMQKRKEPHTTAITQVIEILRKGL